MSPTSCLYDALSRYLSQRNIHWQDVRHLQTLCWMMIGIIQSQNVRTYATVTSDGAIAPH